MILKYTHRFSSLLFDSSVKIIFSNWLDQITLTQLSLGDTVEHYFCIIFLENFCEHRFHVMFVKK